MEIDLPLNTPLARFQGELFIARKSSLGSAHRLLIDKLGATSTPGFDHASGYSSLVRDVPVDQLDELFKIRLFFRWRGEKFSVDKLLPDGRMSANLITADARWAQENGLTVIDFAWSMGSFSQDEVEHLTETKEDLLADWKGRN